MAPPPVVKIGPPPAKTGGGIGGKLDTWIKAHAPAWRKYEPALLKWSNVYKMDPLQLAAVLAGIENPSANPNARSSAGALGLAQILDKSVDPNLNPNAIWDGPAVMTDAWKQNPDNAIKYAAWRLAGQVAKYGGDINAAYVNGYNPGYTGTLPSQLLKGYVPTTGPGTQPTSTEGAGPAVAGSVARKGLATTQWAVLTPTGKLKFIATRNSYDSTTGEALPSAPRGTLKMFGQPVTAQDFLRQYQQISDDYLAYTNKRPSYTQAAQVIQQGLSQFQLRQQLAQTPGFVNSPVWKQNAPSYAAVWRSIYGPNSTPDQSAIRNAVANNLGSTAFQDVLRQRPDYNTSSEYKQGYAANENVFRQIYGQPQEADQPVIDMAVKNGYDSNQFAQYLRAQPQWKSSAEAQQLYFGLAQRMGLIQGNQTVLGSGTNG